MRVAVAALALGLWGCGYMGPPLPPALNRPERVPDLAAVERGSTIVIQFTIPKITTEGLDLKQGSRDIDLRVGPPPPGDFTIEKWLLTADRVPMVADNTPAVRVQVPAAKYYGKTVDIAVSVHGPTGGSVGWSRFAIVHVIPALPTPQGLTSTDARDALQLEWRAAAPEFRVFRKLVPDVNWTQIGTSAKPSYTDSMIEYGKTYQYQVQSIQKTDETYVESELSDVYTVAPRDRFPPAVPAGVTAVPGTRTIELVWDRNVEKDFASYRIFRDGKQIADGLTAPTFSDRDVQPKVKYQYQVSALDTAGNESPRSGPVEAMIP